MSQNLQKAILIFNCEQELQKFMEKYPGALPTHKYKRKVVVFNFDCIRQKPVIIEFIKDISGKKLSIFLVIKKFRKEIKWPLQSSNTSS